MKVLAWIGRDPSGRVSAQEADDLIRPSTPDLPQGLPIPGWKAETKRGVTLSSERFANSHPVWIWQE